MFKTIGLSSVKVIASEGITVIAVRKIASNEWYIK